MSVYKRGNVWWYKFTWNGKPLRESTKQSNKRIAEQIEAAHKTSLAKGEVGLRDAKESPTLREFAEGRFMDHIRSHFAEKPKTVSYYADGPRAIEAFPELGNLRLDEIRAEDVHKFVQYLKGFDFEVSTINRRLQALRRIFKLAEEWEATSRALPKVRLLPGEKRRERVLSYEEEEAYLKAAQEIGTAILQAHAEALKGIRATQRGQTPIVPKDPHALLHLGLVLCDCGLRPEEAYRLRWEEYRDGALHIRHGKTASARRVIPVTARTRAALEMRRTQFAADGWIFPAPTQSGHVDQSSLKRQHARACALAGIDKFVPYTFRHTRLTRWAEVMDPYTLAHVAGHSDFATTKRYVHPREETIRDAMRKAEEVQGRHKSGHSAEFGSRAGNSGEPTIN